VFDALLGQMLILGAPGAAANALPHLQRLFARSTLSIPSAIRGELQVAVARGRSYLEVLITAIAAGEIQVLELTEVTTRRGVHRLIAGTAGRVAIRDMHALFQQAIRLRRSCVREAGGAGRTAVVLPSSGEGTRRSYGVGGISSASASAGVRVLRAPKLTLQKKRD
jgi:hypothetical protein